MDYDDQNENSDFSAEKPAAHNWDEEDTGTFVTMNVTAESAPESKPKKEKKTFRLFGLNTDRPSGDAEERQERDPAADRAVRLSRVRQRRKARRMRLLLAAGILILLIIFWFAGIIGSGMAGLADLTDSIVIGLTPGGGYPVRTNISEIYQLYEMSGGFAELGSEDLQVYSAAGSKLRSIQHGYTKPAIACSDTRLCLYNRGGNEFRVESRSRSLYTYNTDESILLCQMSDNGTLAVCTRSSRYAADIHIYSGQMNYKYCWHSSSEAGTPTIMSFSPNSRELAASCIRAEKGSLVSQIFICDTGSTELPLGTESENGIVYKLEWLDKSHLLAVYEDKAVIYNTADGSQRYSCDFEDLGLTAVDTYNGNTAVLFTNESLGTGTLVYLDDTCKTLFRISFNGEGSRVTCTHNYIYVTRGKSVICYDTEGVLQWQLACDEAPQAVLNAKKLLLFSGSKASELVAPVRDAEDSESSSETNASSSASSSSAEAENTAGSTDSNSEESSSEDPGQDSSESGSDESESAAESGSESAA